MTPGLRRKFRNATTARNAGGCAVLFKGCVAYPRLMLAADSGSSSPKQRW